MPQFVQSMTLNGSSQQGVSLVQHRRISPIAINSTAGVTSHLYGAISDGRPSDTQETTDIHHTEQTVVMYGRSESQQTQSGPIREEALTRHSLSFSPIRQPTVPSEKFPTHGRQDLEPPICLGRTAASIYFQPMSSLVADGSPYRPETSSSDTGHRGFVAIPGMTIDNPVNKSISAIVTGIEKMRLGFSPNYGGDVALPNNQSENIPNELNCSLFIVNLPPTLTTHELLAAIHKLGPSGRIYAVHINGPEPARGHPGCAAKVVFFKREIAHAFYAKCARMWDNGGPALPVNDYMARVMWNRIKTSEKLHLSESNASRVLLIAGPSQFVNSRCLTAFFNTKLQFQVDRIVTHVKGSPSGEDAVVEYRFGSFRCQAQAAKMALDREMPHIRCFFGVDPLEPQAWTPLEYYDFQKGF